MNQLDPSSWTEVQATATRATQALATTANVLNEEAAEYAARTLESYKELAQELGQSKDLAQITAAQQRWLARRFDDYVSYAGRVAGLLLSNQAATRVSQEPPAASDG